MLALMCHFKLSCGTAFLRNIETYKKGLERLTFPSWVVFSWNYGVMGCNLGVAPSPPLALEGSPHCVRCSKALRKDYIKESATRHRNIHSRTENEGLFDEFARDLGLLRVQSCASVVFLF